MDNRRTFQKLKACSKPSLAKNLSCCRIMVTVGWGVSHGEWRWGSWERGKPSWVSHGVPGCEERCRWEESTVLALVLTNTLLFRSAPDSRGNSFCVKSCWDGKNTQLGTKFTNGQVCANLLHTSCLLCSWFKYTLARCLTLLGVAYRKMKIFSTNCQNENIYLNLLKHIIYKRHLVFCKLHLFIADTNTTCLFCSRYCAFWIWSCVPAMVMMRSSEPCNGSSILMDAPDSRRICLILWPPFPIMDPANWKQHMKNDICVYTCTLYKDLK